MNNITFVELMKGIVTGNAVIDGKETRSWFIGSFLENDSDRKDDAVEMKWATHSAGDIRSEPAASKSAKSLAVLISGKIKYIFPDAKKDVMLIKQGDYVFWDAGVSHSYEVPVDATVMTIRWPSKHS